MDVLLYTAKDTVDVVCGDDIIIDFTLEYVGPLPPTNIGDANVTIQLGNVGTIKYNAFLEDISSATTDLSENMVAHWHFDEGSGGTATDATSNSNDGVLLGSPAWSRGKSSSSVSFDGTDDGISVANHSSINIDQGTVSLWFNTDGCMEDGTYANWCGIFTKHDAYGIYLRYSSNQLVLFDWVKNKNSGEGMVETGVSITSNTWYHLVFVFDSGVSNSSKVYLDGKLIFTTTYTTLNQDSDLLIGAGAILETPVQRFTGEIDEIRLYDVPKDADFVNALYEEF